MNIVCEKTLLSNAIDGVSRAVTLRSSISALEGIHMVADGFSLTNWEGGGGSPVTIWNWPSPSPSKPMCAPPVSAC